MRCAASTYDLPYAAIEKAALGATGVSKRVLGVTREDVVSSDFNGDPRSCIFDAKVCVRACVCMYTPS